MRGITLLVVMVMLVSTPSFAELGENVERLSEILQTGYYQEIEIEGNRLYATSYYGFEVIDISDPENPVVIGRAPSLENSEEIAVKDGYVYLTDWIRGVYCYDARDPENISKIWTFPENPPDLNLFEDVKVHENRLYVCAWNRGVEIFDIEDPSSPRHLGTYPTCQLPCAITFKDSLAIIGDYVREGFLVVDLRDVGRFIAHGSGSASGRVDDILAAGDLLFTSTSNGYAIHGIRNTPRPSRLRMIRSDKWIHCVNVKDNFIFVSESGGALKIMDITEPTQPQEVFADDTTFYNWGNVHFIDEDRALIAGYYDGLALYNFENPEEPERLARHDLLSPTVYKMAVANGYVYLPRYNEGLMVIDATDPINPEIMNPADTTHCSRVLAYNGEILFSSSAVLGSDENLLKIWSLDNPESPELIGEQLIDASFPDMDVYGEIMSLNGYNSDIELWDISVPEEPMLLSRIDNMGYRYTSLFGDYLYAIGGDNDILYVIDIIDPENPEILSEYDGFEFGYGLDSDQSRVYVSDGDNGVIVLDVSDPGRIEREATIQTREWAVNVAIDDTLLYICDSDGGLKITDISENGIYEEMGWLNTPGRVVNTVVENGICYIADYYDLTIGCYGEYNGIPFKPEKSPTEFALYPAYPNPFNGKTRYSFSLAVQSEVHVTITDWLGREVYNHRQIYNPGNQALSWDGSDMPSGSYVLDLDVFGRSTERPEFNSNQKLILVK